MMAIILDGNPATRSFQVDLAVANNAILIANYDALSSTPKILDVEWDFIYMDECHKLKGGANSSPTLVWQNTQKICENAEFIVPLSGTPIQNHPKEMWSYLHLFRPDIFPSAKRFEREFCFGWPDIQVDFDRIIKTLAGQVIRQNPEMIWANRPTKERIYHVVDHTDAQEKVYAQVRDDFMLYLDSQDPDKKMPFNHLLPQINRLRQINVWPASITYKDELTGATKRLDVNESAKIDEAMDLIEQIVAEGENVIVWSAQFNEPLFELGRRCEYQEYSYALMTGDTKNPADVEARFQNGEIQVLLCNRVSAGEVYSFHKNPERWTGGAKHAIFLDLWWNPSSNEQAEDRIWRDGSKEPVQIHIIQIEGSVDAFIANKLEQKEEMTEGIMSREELRPGDWKALLGGLL